MDFKNKSNEQILREMNQMRLDHDNLKQKIAKLFDELLIIENYYDIANKEINKRLKGEI